ncbi:MAG: type II toxin-antitoxin system VapC family toxin [Chroococcidiopsidaceae cyanobacterium CP_BM_ER_R8_30]|nr:type II toxin-antitoxin system VapC family toxin [Chroococcidiopsidaceae cyanobacterium CP_BM_ER_R8_30]
MRYLLDTDHISFLQRRSGSKFANLVARIAQHSSTDFALCIISFHEQVLGTHNFINRARTTADVMRGYMLLSEILQGFSAAPVLPFDAGAVTIFDELRVLKIRVSTMDLRIAAIALSRNLVLLTRNTSDFSKVPGLVIEDWTVD